MFSRSLFCALLGFYFSALAAEAAPRFGGGFKQDDSASASCDLASIVTQTVTVTASAASATATSGNANAGSGNSSSGGSGAGNSGNNSGNSGKGATGGNANSGGSGSDNTSTGGAAGSGNTGSNAGNTGSNNGAGNAATGGNANSGGSGSDNTSTGGAAGSGNTGANAGTGTGNADVDAQSSLTLDPRVIAKGFANDGQDVPAAGQVSSLTSTNNFINFCLTVPNLPITDGKQITTGSCNPAPIGAIPSTDNMPSSKFVNPPNFGTVQADTAFTITMAINNIQTGNFVNAQENYFAAPQQLTGSGLIIGHSHVVVETIDSLDQKTPTNPKNFAFFKGINGQAVNGVVTADVTSGLPAGVYRLCSINSSANHQPVIVPIAQHGSLDDCIYFTSTANGQAAGQAAGIVASSKAEASATATDISSSAAAAVATNSAVSSAISSATAVASDASASVKGGVSASSATDVPVASAVADITSSADASVTPAPSASAIDNGSADSALPSSASDSLEAAPSASAVSGNGHEGNKKGHGKGN